MKRPLAYITAHWRNDAESMENAVDYCRAVFDAGYAPICPYLYLPAFIDDAVPQEHKDGIDMARDMLKRSRLLVVCGDYADETVKNDVAVAGRLRIMATTLEGLLTARNCRKMLSQEGN